MSSLLKRHVFNNDFALIHQKKKNNDFALKQTFGLHKKKGRHLGSDIVKSGCDFTDKSINSSA